MQLISVLYGVKEHSVILYGSKSLRLKGPGKGVPDRTTFTGGRHEERIWQPFSFAGGVEDTAK